jgi:hypothetical protein
MGAVNLSLSDLVAGGAGLDGMHEAHHVHHPVPGGVGASDDLQPDEETAEDEVRVAQALAAKLIVESLFILCAGTHW